jgi:hypothetical protein
VTNALTGETLWQGWKMLEVFGWLAEFGHGSKCVGQVELSTKMTWMKIIFDKYKMTNLNQHF